jgi:hypothetical protein
MTNARDKVRRFVRQFLSIQPPDYFFHQTLTFSETISDEKEAKRRLKRLLERSFFQGVLFVQEHHGKGGLHFHLPLYFYAKHGLPFSASRMRNGVASAVFSAWNEINGGALARGANRMTVWPPTFATVEYLTKEGRYSGTKPDGDGNWWGTRNDKFLIRRLPLKREVQQWMAMLYPRDRVPVGFRVTERDIQRERKSFIEVSLGDAEREWEEFKLRQLGSEKVVSDAEYLEYRKRDAERWKARMRSLRRKLI